jgi:hypothetical protein
MTANIRKKFLTRKEKLKYFYKLRIKMQNVQPKFLTSAESVQKKDDSPVKMLACR